MAASLKEAFGIEEDDLFGGMGSDDVKTGAYSPKAVKNKGRKFPRASRIDGSKRGLHDNFTDDMKKAIANAKLQNDKELVGMLHVLGETMAMRISDYDGKVERENVSDNMEKVTKSFTELISVFSEADTELDALSDESGSEEPEKREPAPARGMTSPRSMGMRRMA